uniref:Uncharacterized protein n=1 Tax=Manihot esculenta TaxID=3983 RepID=A0A199UC36_MANES
MKWCFSGCGTSICWLLNFRSTILRVVNCMLKVILIYLLNFNLFF